jgi:cysteine desulfurase
MEVYLDYHAATPLAPAAREEMERVAAIAWANPSSAHAAGRAARAVLERARERIAAAIGAAPADLVLVSGGTEACNLGVLGLAGEQPAHLITSAIEHPAVSAAVEELERRGWRVSRLPVPRGRPPSAAEVAAMITPDTALAAIQWVNHETGTILPVAEHAAALRAHGVPLFVDATQALGKIPIDVRTLGVTALAIASHKIGGPAGAGALWIARDASLAPRVVGGAQERGRRAGSPDVVAAAGFGAACAVLRHWLEAMPAIAARRDRLEQAALALGGVPCGNEGPRVATCASIAFPGWRGTALVAALDLEGVAVSSGAACSSGVDRPSPVIAAMHADEPWRAASAVRFSLGPETDDAAIDHALAALRRVLARPPA